MNELPEWDKRCFKRRKLDMAYKEFTEKYACLFMLLELQREDTETICQIIFAEIMFRSLLIILVSTLPS